MDLNIFDKYVTTRNENATETYGELFGSEEIDFVAKRGADCEEGKLQRT